MKRVGVLLAGAVAASGLFAGVASAAPSARSGNCIPESLALIGPDGSSICLTTKVPSIAPPFRASRELNGSQWTWCLYTQPLYHGAIVTVPAFSAADVKATFASAHHC